MATLLSIYTLGFLVPTTLGYNLLRDYSGSTFFDGWDFYGAPDNLTNGTMNGFTSLETYFIFRRERQLGVGGGGHERASCVREQPRSRYTQGGQHDKC